jgi:hypothetical protein
MCLVGASGNKIRVLLICFLIQIVIDIDTKSIVNKEFLTDVEVFYVRLHDHK